MEPVSPLPPDADTATLLAAMSRGDRRAAAVFIERYAPVIRERFRSRLGPSLRKLMDTADLVSTVGRRLDRLVDAGRLDVANEAQLWALINTLARAAIADKTRVLARLRRVEGPDSQWARGFLSRCQPGAADPDPFDGTIATAMDALAEEEDRRVLALWLAGWNHAQIAAEFDCTPNAIRQRWHRIRQRLEVALAA